MNDPAKKGKSKGYEIIKMSVWGGGYRLVGNTLGRRDGVALKCYAGHFRLNYRVNGNPRRTLGWEERKKGLV